MDKNNPPLHMDKHTRNQRLYKNLTEMGLVCSPIFADDDQSLIEAIYVSTEIPSIPCQIGTPVKRSQVSKAITPPVRNGDNVIEFPTIL